ncbi:peptidoglycan D,D-transpeptidase FtsI family protein [Microlunatus sp. Y2014]|uniref:peptidoglycan D,D-transpeptidase FtsI family protein n=1 Tax=Microlunatus sp. Y2014 TaxID=3418488 RepID=UPI003DA6D406
MLVVCAIMVSVMAGRLLQLQAFDTSGDAAAAAAKLQNSMPLLPARGEITDANGVPLATTEMAFAITADPTLTNPTKDGRPTKDNKVTQIAEVLQRHLGGSLDDYLPALTKPDTRFAYVAKKVPAATYAAIVAELNEIGAVGIFRENDPIRSYPNGTVASNIVGFTGYEGEGLAGLEYSLNQQLTGTPGEEVYERAPNGNRIPLGTNVVTPAVDGTNYQLTIDADLQFLAEQRLAAQVKQVQAKSGMVIVMDVRTGQLLAMANYPTYDPNAPGQGKPANMGNRAVQMAYEPGSVQKILSVAAVMEEGLAEPDTKVVVPESARAGGITVRDVWAHGTIHLTTRGVLAKSSNIGTIMLTRQLTEEQLHDRLRSFGLGERTGIELPGEATGALPPRDMPGWQRDQISFGQGLSVTAVQEAAAVAGILNGGVYNPPTIIKGATDNEGNPVEVPRRESRRVVSPETSEQMAGMLESILYNENQVKYLGLENYRTGGKTGTAERYDAECGCYRGRTTSYLGFAPAEDPRIVTYVVLDDVVKGNSGTTTAGPVFQDVTNAALPKLGVLPSTTKRPTKDLEW